MKQQINLYQYLPTGPKYKITKKTVMYVYVIFFIILLIDFANHYWKVHKLYVEKTQLEQQLQTEQKKLADVLKQYPILNTKDLSGTLLELQKQINQRIKLSQLISHGKSFSSYLIALSQSLVPNVWLNEMTISNLDQKIGLQGFALQAVSVQLFLDNLTKNPVFQPMVLDIQNLTQIKNEKNYTFLSFQASNKTVVKNE